MSKYILVTALQQYRMQYVVEVPDEPGVCGAETWAMDTVTCQEAKEFTQKDLGETIIDAREVTIGQALAKFRKDEPTYTWNDDVIINTLVTRLEDQNYES